MVQGVSEILGVASLEPPPCALACLVVLRGPRRWTFFIDSSVLLLFSLSLPLECAVWARAWLVTSPNFHAGLDMIGGAVPRTAMTMGRWSGMVQDVSTGR